MGEGERIDPDFDSDPDENSREEGDMFTPEEIVRIAVRIEKNGERIYREAMGRVADSRLKELLAWMAEEELRHVRWFEDLLQHLDTLNAAIEESVPQALLDEILDRRAFSLEEIRFDDLSDPDELIAVSIEFEQDTVLFYEMLKSFIEDETVAAVLDRIIDEERDHIKKFQERLETPSSGGWGKPQ